MASYYNENDRRAAQWLRNLISAGLIADGLVDERSIIEVEPVDLRGFTQCHFFAGIGGWSYALQLAGWPNEAEIWTGSCPCQPLSIAGQRFGHADERHIWAAFYRLISECRPAVVFGEQVASKDGREWLAGVRADLEAAGYACGCADLCAAGVGAPHIRQRLYWMGAANGARWIQGEQAAASMGYGNPSESAGDTIGVANAECAGIWSESRNHGNAPSEDQGAEEKRQWLRADSCTGSERKLSGLGDSIVYGREGSQDGVPPRPVRSPSWDASQFVLCHDGAKRRIPIESALFPLADGFSGRVGILRGSGNAIVPQVAAEFISAFMEVDRATA